MLFARSVRRNICYGLEAEDGVPSQDVPSAADVERAARLANAHDFISAMPQGYDTVSCRLSLLSACQLRTCSLESGSWGIAIMGPSWRALDGLMAP